MNTADYRRTRFACFFAYLAMSSIFVLPPMLFTTFRNMYGISFTLLGTLIVVNFCTQLGIDLVFTFFSDKFNIRMTARIMPLLTSLGLLIYALVPTLLPQYAYAGLVVGTIIFSVAAGLCEVLLSPLVASLPSEHPEKDMSLLHSLYGWGVVSVVLISSLYFYFVGTEHWVYLTLFWAMLPLAASALFFAAPIPDNVMASSDNGGRRGKWGRIILLCVVCIFLGSAAENTMTNWISGYMEIALSIPKEIGDALGLAVFALLLAITRVLYAKYSPSISKTLLVSMVGAVVCYFVAGLSGNRIFAFVACIVTGVFTSMLWPGTLILMEEKAPSPGVAAYALMAAGGDLGAAGAPQLIGIIVDKVAANQAVIEYAAAAGVTPEETGMKVGMLIAAIFPILGAALMVYIMKRYKAGKAA